MAAPVKYNRETLVAAALELVRADKPCDARSLAKALGCSTQPIFRNFPSMEALRQAVLQAALDRYHHFMDEAVRTSAMPVYKAKGMAYIDFARQEPALFRLLFMRNRAGESESPEIVDWLPDTARAGASAGLAGQDAEDFHLEMWAAVHGVAAMLATGYLQLDKDTVSRMLTDVFQGVKQQWEAKK